MKTEYVILAIIFIHWVADFLLQSYGMATNKHKNNTVLAIHSLIYSFVFFLVGMFFFDIIQVTLFFMVTFVFHFITDYFTSRINTKLYNQRKYYGFIGFFPMIGLDQVLHYAQLIICYDILLK